MAQEEFDDYFLGQEINWDADLIPVNVFVELPFWLMVRNNTVSVIINGHEFKIEITDHFHELYGTLVHESRNTCCYIGPIEKIDDAIMTDAKSRNIPTLWRKCKTVLNIHSLCSGDVFENRNDRHNVENNLYLKTFCEAHIQVVNELIQRYRLATYDYFPFEVTPWTVPTWFVNPAKTNAVKKVCLLDYKRWDYKPTLINSNNEGTAYELISPEELQQCILTPKESFGEYHLIDALNLMEIGDYNGGVRRIATAIEVLVENLLIATLSASLQETEASKILKKIRNNFPEKLKKYA